MSLISIVKIGLKKVFKANSSYRNGVRIVPFARSEDVFSNFNLLETPPETQHYQDVMVGSTIPSYDFIGKVRDSSLSHLGITNGSILFCRNIDKIFKPKPGYVIAALLNSGAGNTGWLQIASIESISNNVIISFTDVHGELRKRHITINDIKGHAIHAVESFEKPIRTRGPYNRSLVYIG